MNFKEVIVPFRFRKIRQFSKIAQPAVLDVGCANDAPKLTHRHFPGCNYDAIDFVAPSAENMLHINNFHLMDLDTLDFSQLGDAQYDIVILVHVIEHLRFGIEVTKALASRVKPGGVMYVEYPRVASLGFPSAVNTLQFCDDPTHIRLYDLKEISNSLLDSGLRVLDGGTRRDIIRLVLSPLSIPLQIATLLQSKRLNARGLWDIYGFAEYAIGVRPSCAIQVDQEKALG